MGNKNSSSNGKANVELSDDAIEVLMANTNFSRFEVIEWFEGFVKDNPSGSLTKSDFEKTYKQLYPDGDCKKYSGFVFSAFDADSSGSIDFREFLLALSALSDRDLAKRLNLIFRIYDLNHNNQIDAKELAKIIESLYDLKGVDKQDRSGAKFVKSRVELILKSLDKDSDGVLTQEEFVDGCLNDSFIADLLLPPPAN